MRIALLAVAVLLAVPAAAAAPGAKPRIADCGEIVAPTRPRFAEPWRIVLETVAIRTYVAPPARTKNARWPFRSPTGLIVRGYAQPVHVSVAPAWRARAAISWGDTAIGSSVRIASCRATSDRKAWNAFAGGFYLRKRADCVPLVFRMGSRAETVRVGVGRRCPA